MASAMHIVVALAASCELWWVKSFPLLIGFGTIVHVNITPFDWPLAYLSVKRARTSIDLSGSSAFIY